MSKSRDAFRTISEVAELLDTPAHVLRFWETKFSQVKPVKRAGGRRYYRPGDVALLAGIRQLLHDDGLTIKGVQKVLREQGVKHVAAIAPPPELDDDIVASEPPAQEAVPGIEPEAELDTPPVLPAAEAEPGAEAPVDAPVQQEERPEPQESATVLPFAQVGSAAPAAPAPVSGEDDPAGDLPQDVPAVGLTPPLFPESEDPEPHAPKQAALWDEDPEAGPTEVVAEPSDEITDESPEVLPDFLTSSFEDRGAAPLPAAAALPGIPDLTALPQPAPGPLASLARLRKISPEQAPELALQVSALRAFLAARQGAELS